MGDGVDDGVLRHDSGNGGRGLELELEPSQKLLLLWVLGFLFLRVPSEVVPLVRVPGPGTVDLESLGCSVAVIVAPRRWTWLPLRE